MKLSNRIIAVIQKYSDSDYIDNVPKYVIKHDLEAIGIDIKPCYDNEILRDIMSVLVRRISNE